MPLSDYKESLSRVISFGTTKRCAVKVKAETLWEVGGSSEWLCSR